MVVSSAVYYASLQGGGTKLHKDDEFRSIAINLVKNKQDSR